MIFIVVGLVKQSLLKPGLTVLTFSYVLEHRVAEIFTKWAVGKRLDRTHLMRI